MLHGYMSHYSCLIRGSLLSTLQTYDTVKLEPSSGFSVIMFNVFTDYIFYYERSEFLIVADGQNSTQKNVRRR